MSYTPTTWVTGDTITATKLNNMEQGIANAGGTSFAIITLSATGFSSASRTFGHVTYGMYKNNRWELISDDFVNESSTITIPIFGMAAPYQTALPPMIIPSGDIMYPFFVPFGNSVGIETTGDIDDTPTNLHFSWGSVTSAFKIRGSGSIELVAS